VREALTNAVVHGNREDPNKLVFVTSRCSEDGEVSITVRDEGQGFDSRAVPDPTVPENLLSSHGRGIYVMRKLMDEVSFEQNGTVLKMRKRPNKKANAERKLD
jgi:serine/threonine-protein kinase RsbW